MPDDTPRRSSKGSSSRPPSRGASRPAGGGRSRSKPDSGSRGKRSSSGRSDKGARGPKGEGGGPSRGRTQGPRPSSDSRGGDDRGYKGSGSGGSGSSRGGYKSSGKPSSAGRSESGYKGSRKPAGSSGGYKGSRSESAEGSQRGYKGSRGPSGSSEGGYKGSRKPAGSSGGYKGSRSESAEGSERGYKGGKPSGSASGRGSKGSDGQRRSDSERGSGGRESGGYRSDRGRGAPAGARGYGGSDSRRGPQDRSDRSGGYRGGRDERPERVPREDDLPWPDEIFDMELDPELRAELEAVGGTSGALVKHLLSVQVLAEDDPEAAYQHAERLRQRMPRSALARQTACITAYRAGKFREAIKEEAAYRRVSNRLDLVPIAADCERGLGRPQRALALVTEFEGQKLDADTRTELLIVGGGAREDLGDEEAARVLLQKAVRTARSPMAIARSRYALGRLLVDSDPEQARRWLTSAVTVDEEGIWTDAAEFLESL